MVHNNKYHKKLRITKIMLKNKCSPTQTVERRGESSENNETQQKELRSIALRRTRRRHKII
jgi:hypothetical protein